MYGIVLDGKNNPGITGLTTVPVRDKIKAEASLEEAIIKLNQLYQQVPNTDCNRCGSCCDVSKTGVVTVYSLEFLNINRFLSSPPNKDVKRRMYGTAMFGKALLKRKKQEKSNPNNQSGNHLLIRFCPAHDPQTKLCLIHECKPLVCRLYGLDRWSKESQEWVRKEEGRHCDQVKISEQDQTEYWSPSRGASLLEQLKRLSGYYYIDEAEGAVFNTNVLTNWLTLGFTQPIHKKA